MRFRRRLGRTWSRMRRRHPPACPDGWITSPPEFIGVGAQKAGTSWWYHLISRHPAVCHFGHPKELHFFDQFSERPFGAVDTERYGRYFPRPPGTLAGEWTPSYMYHYWVPSLLPRAAPDTRLLVVLRDPVERYLSAITMQHDRGDRDPVWAADAFHRGFYGIQLCQLLRHFPMERVLVLQYELSRADPKAQLARTYRFLGLDEAFVPEDLTLKMNPTPTEPFAPYPDQRHQLIEAYEPDIECLLEFDIEIDLSLWPNMRHMAR